MFEIYDKTITARQAAERFAREVCDDPRKVACYLIEPPRFQLVGGWRWYRIEPLPNYAGWGIVAENGDEDCEAFKLANDPPRVRPQSFDNGEKTRQRVLVDGLNCLPGQLDLFD